MPQPQPPSRPWHVALISFVVLTLELAFIRQVPAEVMLISYFTNLMLMAAFFGLGVGCLLQHRRSLGLLLPVGLCLVAAFVYFGRGLVVVEQARDVHYWTGYTRPPGLAPELPVFPTALLSFVVCALPFVALGQRLATSMNAHPRLVSYGWDIAGSVLGIAAFAAGSAAWLPPWVWPPATMGLWALVLERTWRSRIVHALAGLVFVVFAHADLEGAWSPYYFVQHRQEKQGLRVWVNSAFHQLAIDYVGTSEEDRRHQRVTRERFEVPYGVYREQHGGAGPKRVLVLGAGTGNDVYIALHNEARHVTAVEIDPVIMELGRRKNRTAPYADRRVHVVIDDARHFLRSTSDRFDLIVFGTLDSQTLMSSQANLRLENYVYTREAMRDARARLVHGGMVVAYYSAAKPWLTGRLYRTVCDEFPGHCQLYTSSQPYLFNTILVGAPDLAGLRSDPAMEASFAKQIPATDDWPFLYLQHPGVSPLYLKLIGAVSLLIAAAFWLLRRVEGGPVAGRWPFLLLGMGFTLMEAAAVVRLALLFGSTWVINAVVFGAVLCMVFLANLAVLRGRAPRHELAWPGLFAGVVLCYAISPSLLVGLDPLARVVACAALIGAPVFFASVCFSRAFERQSSTGYALGINLVGAMAGGFVEYTSMLVGMRAVWLLVLVVYLAAYLLEARAARATNELGGLKSS